MADITPTPGFFDGLGDRVVVRDRNVGALEVLRLRPDLTGDAAFEPKVRARIQQLASVQHPGLGRVRHVGRLASPDNRLAIVSDLAEGQRLSEVLQATEQMSLALHTNAALFLVRQLVSAVSCLHGQGPDVSHGALGPERLVISSTGRLVAVEQVLGSALPHLPHMQPPRVWKELRLALAADEQPPFGRRTDVLQVGLCGLALVLGRPLRLEEYPLRLRDLLDHATESTVTGERRPLRGPLRSWLERTLEAAEPAAKPWTIEEAREALDGLLASDGYLATPTGLATLLETVRRYFAGLDIETPARKDVGTPARKDLETPVTGNLETPRDKDLETLGTVGLEPAVKKGEAEAPPPPASPVARLRLVTPAPAAPSSWTAPLSVARDFGNARTEGSLAVATPLTAPAEVPDESFAPEAGVSFPPDEPEPEPIIAASSLPPPPRPASGAVPVAAAAPIALSSGAVPVAEAIAEPLAGPIAASLARESLAELVHTRPGRSEGSGTHHAPSGSARTSRSMFGSDEDHSTPRQAGRSGMPLKLAGAGGLVAVLAVAGWFIFGGRPATEESSPGPSRPASGAATPAPSRTAGPATEAAGPPAPAGSETLPDSLASAAAAAQEAGSLQLQAPFHLEVFEDGVRLGTTDAPIVLAAGRHQLELVNRDYEFRGQQVVDVRPGRATRVPAKLPTGLANINATPWAEVWIDGARAGETPLGNLSLSIGPHDVVFRHPQLGEQTRTLVVTAGAATRLSVEMQQ